MFPNAVLDASFSGGASRFLESFRALTDLEVQVSVLRILDEKASQHVRAFEEACGDSNLRMRERAVDWEDFTVPSVAAPVGRFALVWNSAFLPNTVAFPSMPAIQPFVRSKVRSLQPHLIWAEWSLCGAIALGLRLGVPWVYAHHDWQYRILRVRRAASARPHYLSSVLREWSIKRLEIRMVRKARVVITGSQTEAREIRKYGARTVHTIPTAFEAVPEPAKEVKPVQPARICHLGALGTTANYLGLMDYLRKVQPALSNLSADKTSLLPTLTIIGDSSGAKPKLLHELLKAQAELLGHVPNLSGVLRPFDLAVIPYESNTGTRTKLPLLFNFAQVVIATRAAIAGTLEARHDDNCIVVDSLEDFVPVIMALAKDPERRERIGRRAKETFELNFTPSAQLPAFRQVLADLSLPC